MSFTHCSCYEYHSPSFIETEFGSYTNDKKDTRSQGIGVNEEELEVQSVVETRSEQTDTTYEETHYVLQVDENIGCVLYCSDGNLCSCCESWSQGDNSEELKIAEDQRSMYLYDDQPIEAQGCIVSYQTMSRHETADRGTTADLLMTTDMLDKSILDMTTPIVPIRYHGSKCCVEINVMEKHGDGCRYNDQIKTPEKTDSYNLIRRLNILTCSMDTSPVDEPLPPKITLDDVYPVFTQSQPPGFKLPEVLSDEKMSILEECFKHKRLVDSLVRSSKSFPNFKSMHKVAACTAEISTRPYNVQELFFHRKSDRCIATSDKSVQIKIKYWRTKKWFYSIFSCMLPYN